MARAKKDRKEPAGAKLAARGVKPIQVVIQFETGNETGRRVVIELGQSRSFGRGQKADVQLPYDTLLSGVHFAVDCTEAGAKIRDLGSRNGTKLNGAAVKEAALRNSDYITAGNTGFSVALVVAGQAARQSAQRGEAAPPPAPMAPPAAEKFAPPAEKASPFAADWNAKPAVMAPPPRPAAVSAEPEVESGEPVDLLEFLRTQKEPLYAVLDAARDARIFPLLVHFGYQTPVPTSKYSRDENGDENASAQGKPQPSAPAPADAAPAGSAPGDAPSGEPSPAEQYWKEVAARRHEIQSLYGGYKALELEPFAPYLVRLPPDSQLLRILVEQAWGQAWGIYLTCDQPFAEVRKHLRKFLMVEMPDGKKAYFRFYDPRALRVFLPNCSKEERAQFVGPVSNFLLEGESPLELDRQRGERSTHVTLLPRAPAVQAAQVVS